MQDATAGRHPLGVAFCDQAAAAVGVVVGDLTIEDVADRLDPAVGMPGCPLRLFGAVDRRPDVIEQKERVRLGQRKVAGEGPGDDEAGPFCLAAGGDDLGDRRGLEVGSGRGMRGRTRVSSTVMAGTRISSSGGLVG
jgi:hypothetical protein